ncbi:MAG: hypothetical protein LBG89_01375 [Rickettsiales bacterium]|jgi:hypothetical protein|nr:hypothetical protein [Rickettsiales bacterium]
MKSIVKGLALTTAVITGVISNGHAASATNLENPLYTPAAGEFYTKLGAGLMYKKANDNLVMQMKDHAGATEFPIWRGSLDLGYGIIDRLAVRGQFQYTHDGDIDRQGMNNGRLGLSYRVFDGKSTDGIVWDVYADAHLGGISEMDATLVNSKNNFGMTEPVTFDYANYSNGRWGAYLGTQVGKTWGKFTGSVFAEVLRTFGNDNNKITISDGVTAAGTGAAWLLVYQQYMVATGGNTATSSAMATAAMATLPDSFSVNTKSTWEYNLGLKSLYEIDEKWSAGAGFTFKHRATNSIKSIVSDNAVIQGMASRFVGPMDDGIDEYIVSVVAARQMNDSIQLGVYGEYTFDDAEAKSQNGTDVKMELGVRLNARF